MKSIDVFTIVVAGGKGIRMGTSQKKQYLLIDKIPVLTQTLLVFDTCRFVDHVILVIPEEDQSFCREQIIAPYPFSHSILLVPGGTHRQDSVQNGLKKVNELVTEKNDAIVLIHDGVRPFISEKLIQECINKAQVHGACIPALRIEETVKKVNKKGCIEKTVDRKDLHSAQTPQAFRLQLLLDAYDRAYKEKFIGTDDASVVEKMGAPVFIVKGSKKNIKITTPHDLILAQYLCEQNKVDFKKTTLKKIND